MAAAMTKACAVMWTTFTTIPSGTAMLLRRAIGLTRRFIAMCGLGCTAPIGDRVMPTMSVQHLAKAEIDGRGCGGIRRLVPPYAGSDAYRTNRGARLTNCTSVVSRKNIDSPPPMPALAACNLYDFWPRSKDILTRVHSGRIVVLGAAFQL